MPSKDIKIKGRMDRQTNLLHRLSWDVGDRSLHQERRYPHPIEKQRPHRFPFLNVNRYLRQVYRRDAKILERSQTEMANGTHFHHLLYQNDEAKKTKPVRQQMMAFSLLPHLRATRYQEHP
jgi:hypothetical protein